MENNFGKKQYGANSDHKFLELILKYPLNCQRHDLK